MYRMTAAFLAAAALTAPAYAGGARDYFAEVDVDFGVTAVGPVLVHYFPIKNTTKQSVQMGTPRIQCGCVSVTLLKGALEPGETTYLIAYMNTAKIPTHQIGVTKSVTVHVPFLTPALEEVATKVTVVARPDLIWSTTDGLAFGTVAAGKGARASMKVTLYGNDKWDVSKVESPGKFIKAEAKVVSRSPGETTYEVVATLDDKCPAGPWMTDVTVRTNAPGIDKMRIPVVVNVAPAISSNPGTLQLGSLPMGGDRTLDVTLTGLEPFKVLGVTGGDDHVSATARTEGARHQHTLKVNVKADAAGDITRELKILTDSKDMPSVLLPVSATVKK